MKELRTQINEIDGQIVALIGKRMKLAQEIGQVKDTSGLPVPDKEREAAIRDALKNLARDHGLEPEFINHLYTHIFVESRRIQENE